MSDYSGQKDYNMTPADSCPRIQHFRERHAKPVKRENHKHGPESRGDDGFS